MKQELTWPEAIQLVLESHPTGLHYAAITEEILAKGLKQQLGATPAATVSAVINSAIKKSAASAPYIRIGKGSFALKKFFSSEVINSYSENSAEKIAEDEAEKQIFQAFGMYWRRDAVSWKANSAILGMKGDKGPYVDFSGQQATYLLHSGHKIIYVGQGALGKRLFEHTKGRMSFRWDRFSWFGLCPIGEDGSMSAMPKSYSAKSMLTSLEALLIEAIEPGLNRQRGQDFGTLEYDQYVG